SCQLVHTGERKNSPLFFRPNSVGGEIYEAPTSNTNPDSRGLHANRHEPNRDDPDDGGDVLGSTTRALPHSDGGGDATGRRDASHGQAGRTSQRKRIDRSRPAA